VTVGASAPPEQDAHSAEQQTRLWESRPVRWSSTSGLLLGAGYLTVLFGAPSTVPTAIFVIATAVGARFFAWEAVEKLWSRRAIDIEFLMTVAALVAGFLGLWGEAAALAFLYSISESLEEFTEDRTRRSIEALMDLAPRRVTRVAADGSEEEVPLEELATEDRFLVRPGQSVPTDGLVLEGHSALDESAITGESAPIEKGPNDRVFAGTMNAQGALLVRATATYQNNTLARIVELVTEAQEEKGSGQRFMERFSAIYSPAVLAAGIAIVLAGGLLSGDWAEWFRRSATVVVAAAPCALVISIPVTYVAAIGNAGRRGVLIKGGIYLEELARVTVLAVDKTGTLTRGEPRLIEVLSLDGRDRDSVLAIAAAVEQRSEHPLARAIVGAADERGLAQPPVEAFRATTGAGAHGRIDGTEYVVGAPRFIASRGVMLDAANETIERLQADGNTVVVLADASQPLAVLGIADTVRDEARGALAALKRLGIKRTVMLTGDNPQTAATIAQRVGIDEVYAELTPEGKIDAIRSLTSKHTHVAMVGDGVNDAPALAAASLGVAMGTAGSDAALEAADVALMGDDLRRLADAVRLGRRTRTVVRQNLGLSFLILALLVPGALLGLFSLPVAVLAHELSELFVIGNGARMTRG
jgi:heavy metal translocating P-type ATPase